MQQHAVPEAPHQEDDGQDALRHQVEQIIAQRLERKNLMKSKSAAEPASPAPTPQPAPRERDFAAELAASIAADKLRRDPSRSPSHAPDRAPDREPVTEIPEDVFEAEFARAIAGDEEPDFAVAFAGDTEPDIARPIAYDTVEAYMPRDELPKPEPVEPERRKGERRQAERRNVEFLRTELQWSASGEDEPKPSLFSKLSGLKSNRFLLLGLAIVSAGVAMALVLSNAPAPAPAPEPVVPVVVEAPSIPTARILVASSTIGAGERIDGSSLTWHEVPETDVLPEYVAESVEADAVTNIDQAIARYPFFPGDPIRTDKLLDASQMSLATTLTPGMRGVSVVVTPEAAAGGFIKPDDRVDVVLSAKGTTRTVLSDVRVLAINTQLGPQTTGDASPPEATEATQIFEGMARATLELDAKAAEVLIGAAATGSLSLTLRPFSDKALAKESVRSGADQAIRLTSPFWADSYSPTAPM